MSLAYQCDRCKTFEPDKPPVRVNLVPEVGTNQSKELCPRCLAGLHDWLDTYARDADHA